MADKAIGKVTHYFDKIGVAIIKTTKPLAIGDTLTFTGPKGTATQTVTSMQMEHETVDKVKAGAEFGLKVDQEVHEGDEVRKV